MERKSDRYNKVTIHLRDWKNKAILERLAKESGMSLSEYTARAIENYFLPYVFKQLNKDKLF